METLVEGFKNQGPYFAFLKFCHLQILKLSLVSFFFLIPQFSLAQIDNNFFNGGGIRVGDSTTACAGNGGGIRFDANSSDGGGLQYCDGTNWLALLTSSFSGVVNNGNSFAAPMIIGTNDNNTLAFETNGSTRMTIDTSGNVGIGTTGPSSLLDIQGSTGIALNRQEISGGNRAWMTDGLKIGSGGSDSAYFGMKEEGANAADAVVAWGDDVTDDLRFIFTQSGGPVDGTEHMRITGTGLVGIGTTAPAHPLDVSGGARFGTSANPRVAINATSGYGELYFERIGTAQFRTGIGIRTGTDNDYSIGRFGSPEDFTILKSNGNVGIGTTSPSEELEVDGDVKAVSFMMTSDKRLKRNISSLPGLETILKLNGYQYEWKKDGQKAYGVIAQEVEEVLPHAVITDKKTDLKAVNYSSLIAPIIETIKDLYQYWARNEEKIHRLENQVEELNQKNADLESRIRLIEEKLK